MKYIILLLFILQVSPNLYADNTVEMLIGSAVVQPFGSSSWQKVAGGQRIKTGDTIQTGPQSFVVIDADGNTIKIQAKTKVKFTQGMVGEKQHNSLSLFGGSVNCKMRKLKKNNESFSVNTASSVCAVRGTEFDVGAGADGNTVLQVTDGTVVLSGLTSSIDVAVNQESSVKLGREPEPVKIIKRRDWDQWANESSGNVKGHESDIIDGCVAKLSRLDADIIQLENESAAARLASDKLQKEAETAKNAGDEKEWTRLSGEAERSLRLSTSLSNRAYYQASRIELVKVVADTAYQSADRKSSVQKQFDAADVIYAKYYNKYIKPILDSEQRRQKIRDRKKKNK